MGGFAQENSVTTLTQTLFHDGGVGMLQPKQRDEENVLLVLTEKTDDIDI